tara:strand:- start:53 stop:451 length:399 start_codon:yes stop_codon:yes gene_type:complete
MKIKFNLKADIPNLNNVIYPKDVLDDAINEYNKKFVESGQAIGQIGQPCNKIKLSDAAFIIKKIKSNNTPYVAEIDILETKQGKILKQILPLNDYRIVTCSVCDLKENKKQETIVKHMIIESVGVELKSNCV